MKMIALLALALLLSPTHVFAHCDTTSGPVVESARAALKSGQIAPVLKWIKPEYEPELKAAFERTLKVRGKDAEAQEFADTYFLETVVRLHRLGENAGFTGLKNEPPEPIIQMAENAISEQSADKLSAALARHMDKELRRRFNAVIAKKAHADDSPAAGREYVAAYVEFMHFLEELHRPLEADAQKASLTAEHQHK